MLTNSMWVNRLIEAFCPTRICCIVIHQHCTTNQWGFGFNSVHSSPTTIQNPNQEFSSGLLSKYPMLLNFSVRVGTSVSNLLLRFIKKLNIG